MSQTKTSSKIHKIIKAAAAAAVLPVLFIYIMIAKPDYRIMNALSHVVVPVAQWVGDVVTWPIRAVGSAIDNISEISSLRTENEELRARLDEALINKYACDIAIKENQKLAQELDLIKSKPQDIIIADIIHDNSVLGHKTFIINRGIKNGIEQGMVVTSTDMVLVGMVIDVASDFARVRALTDSDTNIAVRVVGSEVYGFMTGNGSDTPTMGFFSDPEFQPSAGIKLVTSNISGILPAGLIVGEMIDDTDVKITPISKLSRVMVLKFDAQQNKYK
jgi:rod shape-determining protein MreC